MKILVTGARGFVGRNLIPLLENRGIEVLSLDQEFTCFLTGKDIKSEFKNPVQYQLGSYWGMFSQDERSAKECDGIIHLASSSHVDNSIYGPRTFVDLNVCGTLELFEMSRSLKSEGLLKQILLFSTDETVACLPDRLQAFEDAKIKCGSVYSATKAAQELLAQAYIKTWQLPIVTTRSVNIFGKNQSYEKFIPKVIKSIMNDEEIPLYGSGYQERQWVHIDHVSEYVAEVATSTFIPPGQVLHITGTKEISNITLIYLIAGMLSKKPKIKHVEDRLGHDERYALHKSSETTDFIQLDYESNKTFLADLEKTVSWYEGVLNGK